MARNSSTLHLQKGNSGFIFVNPAKLQPNLNSDPHHFRNAPERSNEDTFTGSLLDAALRVAVPHHVVPQWTEN